MYDLAGAVVERYPPWAGAHLRVDAELRRTRQLVADSRTDLRALHAEVDHLLVAGVRASSPPPPPTTTTTGEAGVERDAAAASAGSSKADATRHVAAMHAVIRIPAVSTPRGDDAAKAPGSKQPRAARASKVRPVSANSWPRASRVQRTTSSPVSTPVAPRRVSAAPTPRSAPLAAERAPYSAPRGVHSPRPSSAAYARAYLVPATLDTRTTVRGRPRSPASDRADPAVQALAFSEGGGARPGPQSPAVAELPSPPDGVAPELALTTKNGVAYVQLLKQMPLSARGPSRAALARGASWPGEAPPATSTDTLAAAGATTPRAGRQGSRRQAWGSRADRGARRGSVEAGTPGRASGTHSPRSARSVPISVHSRAAARARPPAAAHSPRPLSEAAAGSPVTLQPELRQPHRAAMWPHAQAAAAASSTRPPLEDDVALYGHARAERAAGSAPQGSAQPPLSSLDVGALRAQADDAHRRLAAASAAVAAAAAAGVVHGHTQFSPPTVDLGVRAPPPAPASAALARERARPHTARARPSSPPSPPVLQGLAQARAALQLATPALHDDTPRSPRPEGHPAHVTTAGAWVVGPEGAHSAGALRLADAAAAAAARAPHGSAGGPSAPTADVRAGGAHASAGEPPTPAGTRTSARSRRRPVSATALRTTLANGAPSPQATAAALARLQRRQQPLMAAHPLDTAASARRGAGRAAEPPGAAATSHAPGKGHSAAAPAPSALHNTDGHAAPLGQQPAARPQTRPAACASSGAARAGSAPSTPSTASVAAPARAQPAGRAQRACAADEAAHGQPRARVPAGQGATSVRTLRAQLQPSAAAARSRPTGLLRGEQGFPSFSQLVAGASRAATTGSPHSQRFRLVGSS